MDYTQFLNTDSAVLVAVIYAIGVFLKLNQHIADWLIPWILMILAVIFSAWLNGFNASSVMQGILVAATAVMTNNLLKQSLEGLGKS